jgi:prepilin-type N-terminal cleavage/methylation domain-containing protein/prepilin-type processing-associated H-X9-DG protein
MSRGMNGIGRKGSGGCYKRGFTLIELLVVIAIIAILAAILFPVFARARENARRSSCSSNVKQIMLGVIQYTQDYDERFPTAWVTVGGVNIYWAGQIYPYVKSRQLFVCPSDSSSPAPDITRADFAAHSYVGNYGVFGIVGETGPFGPHAIADYNNFGASETIAIGEHNRSTVAVVDPFQPAGDAASTVYPSQNGSTGATAVGGRIYRRRHFEGSNYGFLDGHVKWLKFDNVPRYWCAPGYAAANGVASDCN